MKTKLFTEMERQCDRVFVREPLVVTTSPLFGKFLSFLVFALAYICWVCRFDGARLPCIDIETHFQGVNSLCSFPKDSLL